MPIIDTVRSSPESAPALDYKLYTTPHPIRVSSEGAEEGGSSEIEPERAQLVFVAANNTNRGIRLKKIALRIPVGELAAQLALSLERADASITLGWPSSVSGEWVEFETGDPYEEIAPGGGFSFTVANVPVNHRVGAVELDIEENQATGAHGAMTILTGKFPRDFYLDHFAADKYEIDNGGTVVLTWKRSEGVTTKLIHGGNPPEDVSDREREEVKNVKTTTTFYLIGQVGDVEIMRSVLVTVLNPDMVVNKLTVNSELIVKNSDGSVNLFHISEGNGFGVRAPVKIHDSLTVDETSTLKGAVSAHAALEAHEGAKVYKDLRFTKGNDTENDRLLWADNAGVDVRGKLRLKESSSYSGSGALEVAGKFSVGDFLAADPSDASYGTAPGRFQAGSLVARPGDILVLDQFAVRSSGNSTYFEANENGVNINTIASLIKGRRDRGWGQNGAPTSARPFKAVARTDGILHAQVNMFDWTSKNENQGYKATLELKVDGTWIPVQEAMLRQTGANGRRNSVTVPVRKGQEISLHVTVDGSTWYSRIAAYIKWFPFGSNLDLQVTQSAGAVLGLTDEAGDEVPVEQAAMDGQAEG
ncbi:hypothetical protein J0910_17695 [Nocardiopsis sp. CNT-189]|uniref:hypothetical protein n=1 Tax=Nocardiopsis oceanisediminis TaxID=2816862 RepID=UPI003B39B09B